METINKNPHKEIFLILIFLYTLCSTGITQTKWYKYPGNPVIAPKTINDWDYTIIPKVVLYDQGVYHMWYKGWDPTHNVAYGYAISTNGINWKKY